VHRLPGVCLAALAAAVLPIAGSGCSGSSGPQSAAATIVVTPASGSLTAVGATLQFAALVKDQHGAVIPNPTVAWASSDAAVATVSMSGLVAAVGNGIAQLTATSGSASQGASVTVAQVVAQLVLFSGDGQGGTLGQVLAQPLIVQANDANGYPVPGVVVTFAVTAGAGAAGTPSALTGSDGRARTTWTLGPVAETQTAMASVAAPPGATIAVTAGPYVPGRSYFGRNQYVEYIYGDLPVIVTAPHGGGLRPAEMPDRASPDTLRDSNTQELVRAIDTAFVAATGHHPHVVMCRVHRVKLDCNRELVAAAMGDPEAAQAWAELQSFIAEARAAVVRVQGRGLLIDIHGHGHTLQRLELGYLLSGTQLGLPDSVLNQPPWRDSTSIRDVLGRQAQPLVTVLRGANGLGTLFAGQGFPAVPSAADPAPNGTPYFSGGYLTETYGSRNGGSVSAVQIENNYTGVRDTPGARAAFAGAFVSVVRAYVAAWLGIAT
jgi:N-formylglutamate amidohydrolase